MRNAMELLLTGDSIAGDEAARIGLCNRAYPADELEAAVLAVAEKVAKVSSDLQQLNKRSVHRAMDIMGVRAAIRAGSELQALAAHQASVEERLAHALVEHEGRGRQAGGIDGVVDTGVGWSWSGEQGGGSWTVGSCPVLVGCARRGLALSSGSRRARWRRGPVGGRDRRGRRRQVARDVSSPHRWAPGWQRLFVHVEAEASEPVR